MTWLVYQSFIKERSTDLLKMKDVITAFIVIRKVIAENKDEAIGKFIADTTRLEFLQRIEPVSCFEFDHLKTI